VTAGGGYGFLARSAHVEQASAKIQQINEDVFDTSDNLFVFFLDKPEDVEARKKDVQRVLRSLKEEGALQRVSFYYNVRKEGEPPLADGALEEQGADLPPLRCLMYKGQRRTVVHVGSEVPTEQIVDFFKPLNESLTKAQREFIIPTVNNADFVEDVVNASSSARPILVQMYEDTCMLCFLMRPFVNSLAKLLKTSGVPLQIKRLNIEKNDFPDQCPVARGTPTFVLFRGTEIPPDKWEEFRPKDLVGRICKQCPNLPQRVLESMDEMQIGVSSRFRLFSQLTLWTVEMRRLEELVASLPPLPCSLPSGEEEDEGVAFGMASVPPPPKSSDEDSEFNSIASSMMNKDMKRTDLLPDNLEYLQREIDDIEHDAALLGVMLGQSVIVREAAEEEAMKAQSAAALVR